MLFRKRKTAMPAHFVSIGAGENQVPLITEAVRLGYHIIAVDRNPLAPGAALSNLKIIESVDNHTEIFRHLQETLIYGEVAGVLTRSYGNAVKTACYIAERIGKPLVPFQRIDDFINKRRMKSVLTRAGIPTPEFLAIEQGTSHRKIARLGFPLVVKPVTGHAKKDVRLVSNQRELEQALEGRKSRGTRFIVERFSEGSEIIAAGIVFRGTYHLASISDKTLSPAPYFVDIMHTSPSRFEHLHDRITALGQRIAEEFEIAVSPLIMEIMVADDGELSLVEAVPEFGGEFIPDLLIPESTGYRFIRETIKAATNTGFTPPSPRTKKAVVVRYITGTPGRLVSFNGKPRRMNGLVSWKMFKQEGSEIRGVTATNHDRVGVVITRGRSHQAAIDAAERAVAELKITIEN